MEIVQATNEVARISPGQLSPRDSVLTKPYSYQPLSVSKNEFRLLQVLEVDETEEIHAQLANHTLDDVPRYHALSYCWGKASAKKSILLNGLACPVTENLYNALLALRYHGFNTVWIDALCINQLDDDEKSIQVLRMATIFRQAVQVAIWLGPYDTSLLRVVKKWSRADKAAEIDEWEIRTLTMAPYWRRVWIQQEVAVADEPVIIGPSTILDWETFRSALGDTYNSSGEYIGYGGMALESVISLRSKYWSPPSLLQALVQTAHSEATDPRDKIYALLALASDGPRVISLPSYGSQLAQINLQVTLNFFRSEKCLDCICLRRLRRKRDADPMHPTPSWCPDWSDLGGIGLDGRMLQYIGSTQKGWFCTGSVHKKLNWDRMGNRLLVSGSSLGRIWSLSSAQNVAAGPRKNALRKPLFPRKHVDDDVKIAKLLLSCFTQRYTGDLDRWRSEPCKAHLSALDTKTTGLRSWLSENKDLQILGRTIEEILVTVKISSFVLPDYHVTGAPGENTRLDRMVSNIRPDKFGLEYLPQGIRALSDDIEDLLRQQSRLMCTHYGRVGWVHPLADLDDEIYLIEGCTIPIVLRPTSRKDEYIVIGDARVHGVMHGEKWFDHKIRKIVLI